MPEPTVRFLTLGIELKDDDASVLQTIHQTLDRLAQRRKSRLPISDGLEAVLQQVILYRVVATAYGRIVSWNTGNILCSFLAARALLETFALLWDYDRVISEVRKTGTLAEFEALTTRRLAATSDELRLKRNPGHGATNIATLIDRLSREYPGLHKIYDVMSSRSHPNTEGMFEAFADLNTASEEAILSTRDDTFQWAFSLIIRIIDLVSEVERLLDKLQDETPTITKEIRERDFKKLVEKSERQQKDFEQFASDETQAFLGDARSQFAIGRAFATGSPIKDPFRAHFWFSLAEAQGVKEAGKCRERIEPDLTLEQIHESQTLAQAWKRMTPEESSKHDDETIERLQRLYPS
jgi:hypothetical protein